jgi:alanyl-tRNA synthetase
VLVANLHPEVSEKIKAGDIVGEVSGVLGGGGGGGPTMAQAGGGNTEAIPEALTRAREILSRRLANDGE